MNIYTDHTEIDFSENFKRFVRKTYKEQKQETMCSISAGHNTLEIGNSMIEGHGVEFIESLWGSLGNFATDGIEYVNTGDVYNLTVSFDVKNRCFYWQSVGDIMERQHKRFS